MIVDEFNIIFDTKNAGFVNFFFFYFYDVIINLVASFVSCYYIIRKVQGKLNFGVLFPFLFINKNLMTTT